MQSCLYFASTPNLQSLCTVLVKLGSDHSSDNSTALKVQPQVIRCRELIFTDDRVLASPSLQERNHIYVIVQQSYWKTGQFQALCKKLNLEFMKPVRVIPTIFQSCFSYTLKAKLAPLWNKVGELYIHGRDFLVNSGPLPAIDLDLNVTETEICLALKGLGVNFPIPSLSSFRVSPAVLSEFQRKTSQTIPEFSIEEKWSHVLPSLKKGKVVSVTHTIPHTSPFKKYKDIRRYWKNAYGYRLPENDTGIYFFNIHFPMIGSNIFTYPSLCVRRREPQIIPRVDPKSILQAFLKDVKVKMPSVCGLPLQFCDQAKYTKNVMAEATLQVHLLSSNTLTSQPPQSSKKLPMRSLNSIPGAICPPNMLGCMTSESEPTTDRSGTSVDHLSKDIRPSLPVPHHTFSSSQASCPTFRKPFSFQEEQQHMSNISSTARSVISSSRIVPMFQPREIVKTVQHIQPPANRTGPRIVPTFKPNKKRSLPVSEKSATYFQKSSNKTQCGEYIIQMQKKQRMAPREQPVRSKKLPSFTPICTTSCGPMYVSASLPIHVTSSAPMYVTSAVSECVISSVSMTVPVVAGLHHHSSSVGTMPETDPCAIKNVTPFQQEKTPVASAMVLVSADSLPESCPFPSYPSQQQEVFPPDISRSHQKKKVQEVCESNQTVKRARIGPVQAQPNVELMAVNDQLHKVNTVTLSTWLKGKNIYVKSREKKADLIQKVLDFITAQKSEN
ncbi:hypothetical protein HOLleu_13580 [Holothuria leucospilota]|uniref:DUF4708 domain-containing protein n=1 Tax=Holothuria leucospilota TaxID=206669 RepID=A0A9Q1HEU0_HOLLE|nr:hypothetical protein HOLleu_13580 [Holothuria leucospilota]